MNLDLENRLYLIQTRRLHRKDGETLVIYKRLLRMNPKSIDLHYSWAKELIYQEKYQSAVLKLREVLALDPQYHNAVLSMGESLLKQGKNDQAISCLKRGLEIFPSHCDMTYNLAVAMTKKGDYKEALEYCRKVQSSSCELNNWIGYLYFLQGNLKGAIVKFERTLANGSGTEMLYFSKALVLFCQNMEEKEEIKQVFETGMQRVKDWRQRFYLKSSLNHYNSEMSRIRKELEGDDLEPKARVHLEKIYKGLEYILNLLRKEGEKLEKPL